ncbi:MAG: aryl-sulfate sulfotransferase [Bacteroidetes bacterium]|nr:aryl-sulfate sulfotransferase [Bacteroidota bacterium]
MKINILLTILLTSFIMANAQTVGLFTQTSGSQDGYVLFAPNFGNTTYLIDKCGYQVHSWASTHQPGQSAYFLEDGSLLRTGKLTNAVFNAGGLGGIIEKFDWAGNITWTYTISNSTQCQHHDIRLLPNGNVLAISYELKTAAEAVAAGANPNNIGTVVWSDKILEIQPVGLNGGNVIWEWHAWDHLIQDYDSTKANYGVVADHPELLNLNYNLGATTDWLHCNAIDYNAAMDQLILSAHNQNEFYIIDHSTTTLESSSHIGGAHGKGGDFLYRWGNPASYNRGVLADRKLFGQHNPHWIENGLADAGNIMIFNNGINRPGGNYSSVDIISPPVDSSGNYSIAAGQAFLPAAAYWSYQAPVPTSFYAMNISGAQRLINGNTLICSGPNGNFFEVDTSDSVVWKYVSPVGQGGTIFSQGNNPTQNSVFRCTLYNVNYSGFNGMTLTPGNPIELNPLSYNCTMLTTSIQETLQATNEQLVAFPNPFSTGFKIPAEYKNDNIELRNISGQIIYSGTNINDQDFSSL